MPDESSLGVHVINIDESDRKTDLNQLERAEVPSVEVPLIKETYIQSGRYTENDYRQTFPFPKDFHR